MKKIILFITLPLFTACATLNESVLLGVGMGSVTAVVATTSAYDRSGKSLQNEELISQLGLGLVIGALAAYLIHDNTVQYKKDSYYNTPEIYFGDLPPSPFIMTPSEKKKVR